MHTGAEELFHQLRVSGFDFLSDNRQEIVLVGPYNVKTLFFIAFLLSFF